MIYSVTFEWVAGDVAMIRLHEGAGAIYGDDYVWWTVARVHEGANVEMMGADRPIPNGGLLAICDALRAAGFTGRFHDRKKNGKNRRVFKSLTRRDSQ